MVKKRITAKVAAVLVGLMIVSCVQPVAASEWTDETGEVMEMEEPAAETPETEIQQVAMPETIMPEIESELMEEDLLPAGDEDVSQKYTVTLRKPEGGQLVFSESMILPEQEILDEQTADCRAFAKDEVILISAVPEEGYILAEVKAESLTVEGVTYPLEEAAEGMMNLPEETAEKFVFYMPEDNVVFSAVFEKEKSTGTDGTEESVQEMSDSDAEIAEEPVSGIENVKESGGEEAEETEEAEILTQAGGEKVIFSSIYADILSRDVDKVQFNKTSVTVMKGDTITLTYAFVPSNALYVELSCKSSNSSVEPVSINEDKKTVTLKAKEAGTATIVLKAGKRNIKETQCKVTVKTPVSGVTLDRTSAELTKGTSLTLKAAVNPSDATNKTVTWTSSNASVAAVSSSGVVTAKNAGTATITVTTQDGSKKATCKVTVKNPSVSYRTHVQTYGWQGWKSDGAMSGTSGQSKRLEGIEIKISGDSDLGIRYATHVQTYGWQGWKTNGAMSGTSGESKRLEAIRIELTGADASKYDVWYCVHAQHYGWLNWTKNGADAGTAGYAYRLEGIKIKILPKGSSAPAREGSSTTAFYSKNDGPAINMDVSSAGVGYNTHVQTYGWQNYVYNGTMSGTSGQSKRLEGIHIALTNPPYSGGIEYRTHVQTYGWQGWVKNGAMSGTSGQSKRLEAIQIRLTGEMAKHYDVYYRVHAQTYGWLDWARNGDMAGTSGLGKRLEGICIMLVKKGNAAPGSTARPAVTADGQNTSPGTFSKDYFIEQIKQASKFYHDWYLTHGDITPGLISKSDTITGNTSRQKGTYYAVVANGIHSISDMRKQAHRYYTNNCIQKMEQNNRYMGKDWYIERNNKLYLCAPSGLGGGTEVSSADIQVTKESSTSYIVKVRAVYIPFNRVENTTAHYVLENGEWCFDQIMYFPEIESARVTCTVK